MKTVLIIPYFGEFPSYFQLFLYSCKYNQNFTWYIYSDNDKQYEYPDNVKIIHTTFEELKNHIYAKFDFDFEIKTPHKLCDLKPAYGYIFEEDIKAFDYWGFCDMDVIWGDLNQFLTEDILRSYDKIYNIGHLTVFKNTEENNRRFMLPLNGKVVYKEAFKKSREWIFDEGYKESINNIFIDYKFSMLEKTDCADIYTKSSNFRLVTFKNGIEKVIEDNKKGVFLWRNGKLEFYYNESDGLNLKEFAYIHMQKRKMKQKDQIMGEDSFIIVPNRFVCYNEEINEENFKHIKKKYFNLHYFVLRSKYLMHKIKIRLGLLE